MVAWLGAIALLLVCLQRWSSSTTSASGRVLEPDEVHELYDEIADFYDLAAAAYQWFGAGRLADRALHELRPRPGDTVVDLGTGTGRNLTRLAKMVGPTGRVIGVDISAGMLARAQDKVTRRDLSNVELVQADIAAYEPPTDVQAIVATYAIEMLPDYDAVIARMVERLSDNGRIAVTGLRNPQRWPEWLVRLGSAINRPFGVAEEYRSHRPWGIDRPLHHRQLLHRCIRRSRLSGRRQAPGL